MRVEQGGCDWREVNKGHVCSRNATLPLVAKADLDKVRSGAGG